MAPCRQAQRVLCLHRPGAVVGHLHCLLSRHQYRLVAPRLAQLDSAKRLQLCGWQLGGQPPPQRLSALPSLAGLYQPALTASRRRNGWRISGKESRQRR